MTEPADWVSSLAYSWKADGDLRTCLNPTHLNKTIRRDHYRTPTLDEITHELAGSTRFTKVDGSSSYHCIVLDYESSLLTTFNTHRGRFRFVRLPFGLVCAQDRMCTGFKGCNNSNTHSQVTGWHLLIKDTVGDFVRSHVSC